MLSATCPTNRATGKYSNHGRTLNIHFYRRDQQQIYGYCLYIDFLQGTYGTQFHHLSQLAEGTLSSQEGNIKENSNSN